MMEILSSLTTSTVLSIYAAGFVLTFTFLAIFGRKLGINYDVPKDYSNYDDYSSNSEAFVFWSIAWPAVWIFGSIFGAFALLIFLASLVVPYKSETNTETE